MGLIKPFVLGFVIVTIGCHVGLRTTGGTQGVGRATTNAVVAGSVAVIAVDFFVTQMLIVVDVLMADARTRATLDRCSRRRSAHGGPIIVFDHVHWRSTTRSSCGTSASRCMTGHTKIILGASGAGKSTILKIITRAAASPTPGVIWVNGERVDQLTEDEMMAVRADLGMVFQEGALFDSLTVRENVGYKLYEETDMPLDEVDARVEEVLGFVGLGEFIDRMPSELSGGQRRRVAIARAMASKPRHPALRRGDDRPRSDHRDHGRRRDHQAARPRGRQLDRRHAPAARRVLRRRAHGGARRRRQGRRSCRPRREKEREAEFIMLRDGLIVLRRRRRGAARTRRTRTFRRSCR